MVFLKPILLFDRLTLRKSRKLFLPKGMVFRIYANNLLSINGLSPGGPYIDIHHMNTTHRWTNYLIELVIVVIGISIAFSLNEAATRKKHQQEKTDYLIDIRNDLRMDSVQLAHFIRFGQRKGKKMKTLLQHISQEAPVDTIVPYVIEIGNINFFTPDNFTMKSLIQSGDLKLINSDHVKREMLRLLMMYDHIDIMQQNFLQALDDNYFPLLLTKLDLTTMEVVDASFLYSVALRNYTGFTYTETTAHTKHYERTLDQVIKLMDSIDQELGKKQKV